MGVRLTWTDLSGMGVRLTWTDLSGCQVNTD